VKPLYYGLDERKVYFRLRNESLSDQCKTFSTFPQDIIILKNRFCWYYKPVYEDYQKASKLRLKLIELLTDATRKRLMSDVPGGAVVRRLDSSLTSAIASN
jgi:asparagine synthase (glutamine-hydrolysing)